MSIETDIEGALDRSPDAPQPPAAAVASDHLRDLRMVKWWTRLIVYPGVTLLIPLDHFLWGLTWQQALSVHLGGYVIATVAIELAFAQVFKLRKRTAYPGAVALQLGALPTFDAACQALGPSVDELLHLKGSFLTLQQDSGFLSVVALSNLSRIDADRYLRLGAACVQHALTSKRPVALRPGEDLFAQAVVAPGEQVVFVPVQSFQRALGVLALVAGESNADLRDRELLVSMGITLGVSLENLRQRDELRVMAAMDELTTVYNRRHFFDQLDREIAAAQRYDTPVSVLIFDLDSLKSLNDNYGHGLGDEALRTLAQRLVRYSRAADIVARLGGDEFAVILPRTDSAGAAEIARRLQRSVESDVLAVVPGGELRIAVSCGWASFPEDADDASLLLREADGRMYAAKTARSRSVRKRRK